MTTFTMLVSVPDHQAPLDPADLARQIQAQLETGSAVFEAFEVATVDAVGGDRLSQSFAMEKLRVAHKHVAADTYSCRAR